MSLSPVEVYFANLGQALWSTGEVRDALLTSHANSLPTTLHRLHRAPATEGSAPVPNGGLVAPSCSRSQTFWEASASQCCQST